MGKGFAVYFKVTRFLTSSGSSGCVRSVTGPSFCFLKIELFFSTKAKKNRPQRRERIKPKQHLKATSTIIQLLCRSGRFRGGITAYAKKADENVMLCKWLKLGRPKTRTLR
jgi:hypothetical protein